ncbi:MAG: branched-chain amino acid ABC transporter permease [Clostridia bacterium]|nr:branched-chain amino acid ABC transporter permease [Clostridia bacterium]
MKAKKIFKKITKHYLNYAVIAAVMLVFIILAYATPMKASTSLLFQKITVAVIMAVSLSLVVGFLGELSLGHAGFMSIGAYLGGKVALVLTENGNLEASNILVFIIALIVGALCAALCGFIVGFSALRLRGDYLAIVTLAFGEIVRVIFTNSSAESFGGALGLKSPSFKTKEMFILVIIGFLLILLTLFVIQNLLRSKTGRAITAIRDNEIAARATGIDVTKHKLMVFVISAAFAGIAGVLFSYANKPIKADTFDYNYSIEILVMVVLGGMGSINGSIISATLITILNDKLTVYLTGDNAVFKDLFYALILILLVIYNNAPALKGFREKYNLRALINKIRKPKNDPSEIRGDAARWDVVPTKIEMDEVLSTDIIIEKNDRGDDSANIRERGGTK